MEKKPERSKPMTLRPDRVVEEQRPPGSAAPPGAVKLVGFLGRGARPGSWRVYRTIRLDKYIEFDEDDVLFHEAVGPADSQLGGSVVWLKNLAKLDVTRDDTNAEVLFLDGEFTQDGVPTGTIHEFGLGTGLNREVAFTIHTICYEKTCPVYRIKHVSRSFGC